MTGPQPLYILGAGGLAREMAQLAMAALPGHGNEWQLAGFVGTSPEVGKDLGFASVKGTDDWLLSSEGRALIVIGIGHPRSRADAVAKYVAYPDRFEFPDLVHPSALIDRKHVSLGRGNCVTAGCIFTTDVDIGDFNLFNLQVTVGHDARLGSFNVLNPSVNVSGGVRIGDQVLVGTGAQILENLNIADGATVGAGAVVTRDVPAGQTVVGVPARAFGRPLAR